MYKKMKKYPMGGSYRKMNMGGMNGPGDEVTGGPLQNTEMLPPVKPPMNSGPQNAGQTVPVEQPAAPITSGQTATVPTTDPLIVAMNKYKQMGYGDGKARRMAMKEVNPLNKKKTSVSDVVGGISSGLDMVNKATSTAGAISNLFNRKDGGEKKSMFMSAGGTMSGRDLRRKKSFTMEDGGSVAKKAGRKANKAYKKYVGAEKAYSAGNMKKGDRKMKKGDKLASKVNKLQTAKRGGTKMRKR